MQYKISKPNKQLKGEITLDGSKSISNRALIIRALSGLDFPIYGLGDSQDTQTLIRLLESDEEVLDVGPAGTTFRFLTAYLAMQEGTKTLTGSARMKQRPIGILVDCLRELGANIEYEEKEGYPPLKIHAPRQFKSNAHINIPATVSSQYISSLLMIAPCLSGGLRLQLEGEVVSRPYIEMTLRTMANFGIQHTWKGDTIHIEEQAYEAQKFTVEADWSAASYYYALAAFSDETDLYLNGLHKESWQADAAVVQIMEQFGIQTRFTEKGVHLTKIPTDISNFNYNFLNCPDIAQTLAVVCAGQRCEAQLEGLQTLKIKETDRIEALITELKKINIEAEEIKGNILHINSTTHQLHNTSTRQLVNSSTHQTPTFDTYHDHRMAMIFATLALVVGEVVIDDPLVVGKSYPAFWKDLEKLGFTVDGGR